MYCPLTKATDSNVRAYYMYQTYKINIPYRMYKKGSGELKKYLFSQGVQKLGKLSVCPKSLTTSSASSTKII